MPQISRKYDFVPGQKVLSSQVDEEFNQLVDSHNDQDTVLTSLTTRVTTTETNITTNTNNITLYKQAKQTRQVITLVHGKD